jgi:hypothetical protein
MKHETQQNWRQAVPNRDSHYPREGIDDPFKFWLA